LPVYEEMYKQTPVNGSRVWHVGDDNAHPIWVIFPI